MVANETLLGRYVLGSRIATGGMGAVFAATDDRLGREVAIKLLKDELAQDPRFVERFRREARAVAGLTHPNIATVFDYGEDGGRHFIVMELVEGRDLARVLREDGILEPRRAVDIAVQICAALARAHDAGIVHRDVKPANVIVDEHDRTKVTDFGIARAAGDAPLTGTGAVMGTAQYVSPEQASAAAIGPASDIYSLGIVLYEMLTGAVPFTGESPVAVAVRHMNEDVPPPSLLNPRVTAELDHVVSRATAKAPEERWPDAASMAATLERALPGGSGDGRTIDGAATVPLGAPDAAPTERVASSEPAAGPRWVRPALTALGALAAIAVALLLVRAASDDRPEPRPRRASRGTPVAARVEVPNVRGQKFDEAKETLEEHRLEVIRNDVESDKAEDTVVAMFPAAGSRVPAGRAVTLDVSNPEQDHDEDDRGKGKKKGNGKGRGKEGDE